jgi:hypothetical protein
MWRRLIPVLLVMALAAVACGDDESVFEQGGTSLAAPTTTAVQTTTAAETTSTSAPTTTIAQGGSADLGADEQAMADLIAADLLAEGDTGLPVEIDEASAQCLGNQVVATIGLDRLQELQAQGGSGDIGAAMELMTPEEQAAVIGVVLQGAGGQPPCIDVQGFLVDSFTESGLSEGSAQCVAQAFTQGTVLQDLLGVALAAEGSTDELDPAALTPLLTVFATCLTPEELAQMGDLMGDLGS